MNWNNSQNLILTTSFSCPWLLGYVVKRGNGGPTFSSFNAVLLNSPKKYTMVGAPWRIVLYG